jgi:hypothetical protein
MMMKLILVEVSDVRAGKCYVPHNILIVLHHNNMQCVELVTKYFTLQYILLPQTSTTVMIELFLNNTVLRRNIKKVPEK